MWRTPWFGKNAGKLTWVPVSKKRPMALQRREGYRTEEAEALAKQFEDHANAASGTEWAGYYGGGGRNRSW